MMEFMPFALAPAYGVASMPFRPGCHRPFHHSVVLRSYASAVIVVARFSIRLDFFIRFCYPLDIMLQHVLTSTVITLRPFTPYFNSWCLLRQSIFTPLCRWWFRGTHPSWFFAAVTGLEPVLNANLTCWLLIYQLSLPECLAVPPRVNHITPFSTIL